MITHSTAEQWQEWFDATFPQGAKAAALEGSAWVVTSRIFVESMDDGYVTVEFSPWDYDRVLLCKFKEISDEAPSSYAYVQYVTKDVAEGFPGMVFSGDVASANAEVIVERRKRAIESRSF